MYAFLSRLLVTVLLALALPSVSSAQEQFRDYFMRQGDFRVYAWDQPCTPTQIASYDTILNDFDVHTSSPTSALASVAQPKYPCTIILQLVENSGTALDGVITVKGINVYGDPCTEIFYFNDGGTLYGVTKHAYVKLTAVNLDLNDTAASDVLRMAPRAFGVPARVGSLATVTVAGSGVTTGSWDSTYGTWMWASQPADNACLEFRWAGGNVGPRPRGTITHTAVDAAGATSAWPDL